MSTAEKEIGTQKLQNAASEEAISIKLQIEKLEARLAELHQENDSKTDQQSIRYLDRKKAQQIADKIFTEHDALFRKLAE